MARKDAYYFSHDSNAKDDPKCAILIDQLGLEGYGIYWVLIETLRDQPDYKYPLKLIPSIARRYGTTPEKVRAVIMSYELFIVDDNDFFSLSLNRRMLSLDDKKAKAQMAVNARWEKERQRLLSPCASDTDVIQTYNDSNTPVILIREEEKREDKIRGEESKEEERGIKIPYATIQELFNQTCFSLPKIKLLSDKRKRVIKAIWKNEQNEDYFEELFKKTESSDFLSGRSKDWAADFDWVLKSHVKITEGSYDNRVSNVKPIQRGMNTIEDMMNSDVAKQFLKEG